MTTSKKTTIRSANDAYITRNPGLARLVRPVLAMTIVASGDDQWDEYRSSMGENLNSLQESFNAARAARDGYRNWLCRKLDESWTPEDGYAGCEFLLEEITALDASDAGYNSWNARPTVDDLEYGLVADLPRWADMGWTIPELDADGRPNPERNPDAPTKDAQDVIVIPSDDVLAEGAPDLFTVSEKQFATKEAARAFVGRIRDAFKAGDHSSEIIRTTTLKDDEGNYTSETPFVATVLVSDGNWDHRKALADERDRQVNNAFDKIEGCETRQQLLAIGQITKRYSRDMQVLNSGHSHDGARIVNGQIHGRRCGVGFNYVRFATVMNRIADQAEILGLGGFRRYDINEYETTRTPIDGDMLDVGCKQGEFLALEIEDEHTPESLWFQMEKNWKPSAPLAPSRLFISPPPVADVMAWQSGMGYLVSVA